MTFINALITDFSNAPTWVKVVLATAVAVGLIAALFYGLDTHISFGEVESVKKVAEVAEEATQ